MLFDTVTDDDGDAVAVLAYGGLVILRSIERSSGNVQEVFLDASLRRRFTLAWGMAESQAEAHEAASGD